MSEPYQVELNLLNGLIGDIQAGAINEGEVNAGGDQHNQHENRQCAEMIKRIEIRFGKSG
jgi:hypothetical protein